MRLSVQNRSAELSFQATTVDQANVHFQAMLLYSVLNQEEETIMNVAFKFVDQRSLLTALVRSVEGSVRAYVATKKQAEILRLHREIIESVKEQLDNALAEWGYHLIDLQMNDITFDEEILRSMAKVVASSNLKAAAEDEGQPPADHQDQAGRGGRERDQDRRRGRAARCAGRASRCSVTRSRAA